ncbi:MAG: hypothetical protein WBQ34_16300 [Candidatus Acidiferrales bacterium]
MKSRWSCLLSKGAVLATALAAVSLCTGALRAQTSEIAARLPRSTVAFAEWRGTGALTSAAQQNHVLQLMADPAMAPLWLGIAANVQKSEQNSKAPAPALSLPEVISLLQNPAVAGIIEMPHSAESSPATPLPSPLAMFVIYDATGKTQIIVKWQTATDTRGPKPPVVTHFDFGGTSVEARAYDKSTTYSAMAGHYFVVSDQKPAIEQLITRFQGSTSPADSLTKRPEYVEVQKVIGGEGAMDYFARVPDLHQWVATNAKGKNQAGLKFINSLHLEKIHAMGGSVSFSGKAMHMRGAILGNTQPVGPLDFAGPSSASFQTLGVAGAAPEFSVSRVNFAAMYRLVIGAVSTVLPEQQAATVQTAESMAQGFLGMSIPDALDLFTGEVASASSFSEDGTQERTFAATIQKPESVLHILRAVLGPMTLAEDTFGSATVLDIAYPYGDPATGLQRRKMYYVAVTPQMLLVAPRKVVLRDTLESLSASSNAAAQPAKGIFAEPQYAQMRALLPNKLSGLSAEDVTRIPWDALWQNFERQAEQSSKQAAHISKTGYFPDMSWMKLFNPDVVPRHLHMAVGGWWKDTNGVYFDSYVQ